MGEARRRKLQGKKDPTASGLNTPAARKPPASPRTSRSPRPKPTDPQSQIIDQLRVAQQFGPLPPRLRAIAEVRRALDQYELDAVSAARSARLTWQEIAEVLGVTRSAAHQRFSRLEQLSKSRTDGDEVGPG